jgi:hypothetical protein
LDRAVTRLGLLGLLLLVAALAACQQPPAASGTGQPAAGRAPSPSVSPSASPSPVRLQGYRFGRHATVTLPSGAVADVVAESATVHGKVIVVKVTLTGKSGRVDYTPLDWSLLTGDGLNLNPGADDSVPNRLVSGVLAPGQKASGTVLFAGGRDQLHAARVLYSFSGADLAYWVAPT